MEIYERMMRMTGGPAWRRSLALEHVAHGTARIPATFDSATRRAAEYFRQQNRGEAGAAQAGKKHPDLKLAEEAWNQAELRAAVQKLVLANVPSSEVCELMQLKPAVLTWIESLWFDVRPALDATYWIVAKVIKTEADAGRDDVAAEMRVAYFYGPLAAKALINSKLHLPSDRSAQAFDAALLLHARFVQASEMPMSPEQNIEFLKVYAEIRHQEQLLQLARQKLTFQMQRWTDRLELVKSRSITPSHDQGHGSVVGDDHDPMPEDHSPQSHRQPVVAI